LSKIQDMIDPAFVLFDEAREIVRWSRAAAMLFGVASPSSLGMLDGLRTLFHLVDGSFSLVLPAPDGERFYRADAILLDSTDSSLLITFHDQTDHVYLLRRLRESESQLRAIGEATLDAIFIMDGAGRIRYVNAAAERIFGWPVAELRGKDLHTLLAPPSAGEHYQERRQTAGMAKAPVFGAVHELPAVRRDGTTIEIELSLSAFPANEDRAALGVVRDVTERLRRERRLREAEARWQFALEGGGDGVWDWSIASGHILFGPRFKAMLGFEEDEFEDSFEAWQRNVHPDDLQRVQRQLSAYLEGQSPNYVCDFRMLTGRGEYVWIQDRGLIVERDAEGKPSRMVGTQRDIGEGRQATEALQRQLAETMRLNRELEETQIQLVQSEKLAAIGQLSAGVAHEMNTPLGFVSSNLSTLERYVHTLTELVVAWRAAETTLEPAAPLPQFEHLHELYHKADLPYLMEDLPQLFAETRDGLDRVQRIVRDLRDFSRVGEQEWQLVDIHHGLDSTLNILRNQLKHKAEVICDYGDLPELWCIPSQLNQVFLNLLGNAVQAIKDKGTITVQTRCDGERIVLRVSDTGCGIAREEMERIFRPFYTTKPAGEGTGLGLSLAQDIVAKHHGRLYAESEAGLGSTFIVDLPVMSMPDFDTVGRDS